MQALRAQGFCHHLERKERETGFRMWKCLQQARGCQIA